MKFITSVMTALLFAAAPGFQASLVNTNDNLTQVVPGIRSSQQALGHVERFGLATPARTGPEQGIDGTPLPQRGTLRLGREPEATDVWRWILRFTATAKDPLTAGFDRCESSGHSNNSDWPRRRWVWRGCSCCFLDWHATQNVLFRLAGLVLDPTQSRTVSDLRLFVNTP